MESASLTPSGSGVPQEPLLLDCRSQTPHMSRSPSPSASEGVSPVSSPTLTPQCDKGNPAPQPSSHFLRLPKQIRRQIYEYLPVRKKYLPLHRGDADDALWTGKPVTVLVLRYIERTIVKTCRQLAAEAEPILEIETMKLAPSTILIAAEYFDRLALDILHLREKQDDVYFPRLRIGAKERGTATLDEMCIMMWNRILYLQLFSAKLIRIGLYVCQGSRWAEFMEALPQAAKDVVLQVWWPYRDPFPIEMQLRRPLFEFFLEWDDGLLVDKAAGAVMKQCWEIGMLPRIVACEEMALWAFGVWSLREIFTRDESRWKFIEE